MEISDRDLQKIWGQVPVDYYQSGVRQNFFQKMWHTGKVRAVHSLISQKPKTILDVGCASGWFLSKIAKKYPQAQAHGIDAYRKAVQYGNKKYKRLRLKHSDAQNLPYKDGSFDLVICAEVLEHVVDPMKVLSEIYRVLDDNGIAVIEMDSGNLLFRFVWYVWTNLLHGVWEGAHLHAYSAKKLEEQILDSGFIIEKKKTFNWTMAVAFRAVKPSKQS